MRIRAHGMGFSHVYLCCRAVVPVHTLSVHEDGSLNDYQKTYEIFFSWLYLLCSSCYINSESLARNVPSIRVRSKGIMTIMESQRRRI